MEYLLYDAVHLSFPISMSMKLQTTFGAAPPWPQGLIMPARCTCFLALLLICILFQRTALIATAPYFMRSLMRCARHGYGLPFRGPLQCGLMSRRTSVRSCVILVCSTTSCRPIRAYGGIELELLPMASAIGHELKVAL